MALLSAHQLPHEIYIGMTVKGDILTDKDNAGGKTVETCKEIQDSTAVEIGAYRGLTMSLSFDRFTKKFTLHLKG